MGSDECVPPPVQIPDLRSLSLSLSLAASPLLPPPRDSDCTASRHASMRTLGCKGTLPTKVRLQLRARSGFGRGGAASLLAQTYTQHVVTTHLFPHARHLAQVARRVVYTRHGCEAGSHLPPEANPRAREAHQFLI